MKVIIVWEPQDDCVDPLDDARMPRRHAEFLEDDVIVVWREFDERVPSGKRTHFASNGVFSSLEPQDIVKLDRL